VFGARPVSVTEWEVVLLGLQHFDQVGFAALMKYATCESAGFVVDQVIVAVVAVTLVATTLKIGELVRGRPLAAKPVMARIKPKMTTVWNNRSHCFEFNIAAPLGCTLFGPIDREATAVREMQRVKMRWEFLLVES